MYYIEDTYSLTKPCYRQKVLLEYLKNWNMNGLIILYLPDRYM